MKRFLYCAFFGVLAAAIVSTSAFAGTTIDKGDLGKYERQGRFVKPVLSPIATQTTNENDFTHGSKSKVIVDKGERGKYERQGRFLRPVITGFRNSWSGSKKSEPKMGIQHQHGLNGKEHKNVKNK